MDWENERIIVTGGAGFIGSHVVDLLAGMGASVQVWDNLSRGYVSNIRGPLACGRAAIFERDLAGMIPYWGRGCVVFHMAARVTNIHANRRDHLGMMQDNLLVNTNVVESLRRFPPKLAVICSTVCVYPHDARVPTREEWAWPLHPEETNEGYGLAKGILEKQAEFLHRELGVPVVVTRFSNACGPRDYYDRDSSHVVPALIRRISEGEEPLHVWGTGQQTRSFVDARDLAAALVKLAECPAAHDARPVNIGHDREISMMDLARMVAVACGKPDLTILPDTRYPNGHERRSVDNSRLRALLGWVPDRPLEATIADMVREYREGRAHL